MLTDLLKSKFFMGFALVVLILISLFLGKEAHRKYLVNQEVKKLENEILGLEQNNREILKFINYLKTPEYKERQARLVLNLQKPGEFAVALPVREELPHSSELPKPKQEKSNFEKWWDYFFAR